MFEINNIKSFHKVVFGFIVLVFMCSMIFSHSFIIDPNQKYSKNNILLSIQEYNLTSYFDISSEHGHCQNCCIKCNNIIINKSYSFLIYHSEDFLKTSNQNLLNLLFIDSIYHPPELV